MGYFACSATQTSTQFPPLVPLRRDLRQSALFRSIVRLPFS